VASVVDGRSSVDQRHVTTRPTSLGLVTAVLAIAALALPNAASASRSSCANADLTPTSSNVVALRNATFCLINVERRTHGLKPLLSSPQLRRAAQAYSRTMVRGRFFDHVSPSGSTLMTRVRRGTAYLAGAARYALAENIAYGCGYLATPAETVKSWMNSAGHRASILSPRYRHIGVGVALGAPTNDPMGGPAATYTTDFGYRA
jgi:uncharacterized protein YkwD